MTRSTSTYWTYTREMAGPIASMFGKLNPAQRDEVAAEVAAEVRKLSPGGRAVLGGTTWVASGTK